MKIKFLYIAILIGTFGCSTPNSYEILDKFKHTDKFARAFIDKILRGNADSALSYIDPEVVNDNDRQLMTNACHNLTGKQITKYNVVEQSFNTVKMFNKGDVSTYRMGYEYVFDNENILFTTTIKEQNGKLTIISFNGEILPAPLSELTKFSFEGKNFLHYIFFIFAILIPLFILITFLVMLRSRMTLKKKIIWGVLILLISFPQFIISWSNGVCDFHLLNFSILGFGFAKPLYSGWLISFNIPFGAIVFLSMRDLLLSDEVKVKTPISNIVNTETEEN
jgi:hypothetical protein